MLQLSIKPISFCYASFLHSDISSFYINLFFSFLIVISEKVSLVSGDISEHRNVFFVNYLRALHFSKEHFQQTFAGLQDVMKTSSRYF